MHNKHILYTQPYKVHQATVTLPEVTLLPCVVSREDQEGMDTESGELGAGELGGPGLVRVPGGEGGSTDTLAVYLTYLILPCLPTCQT